MGRLLGSFKSEHRSVRRFAVAGALVAATVAAACTSSELRPAAGVATDRGGGIVASDNGVQMRIELGTWRGAPEALRYSAPVYVSITNNSGRPLTIGHDSFRLIDREGETYGTLTPGQIMGQIQRLHDRRGRRPPEAILFSEEPASLSSSGAPPLGPSVTPGPGTVVPPPTLPPSTAAAPGSQPPRLVPDPDSRGFHPKDRSDRSHWASDIYSGAMYEGVIEDGESRSGFVYFESVSRREDELKLTVELEDAESGRTLSRMAVPVRVQ